MQFTIEIDIQGIVANATSHERIQPLLDKAITEALRQSIDEATGYRSEFRKELTAQLIEALPRGLSVDDAAKFQQVLNQTLSQAVQGENVAALQAAISKSMGEIIKKPPTTVKLSEFMETIRSGLHKEDHEEFFAQLEVTDYGFTYLSFDSDEKCQSWHGAEYRLGIMENGEVFSLKMCGVEVKRASLPNVIGEMNGLLMSMYVGRTTMQVDMDADDVADAARSKTDY